MYPADQYLELEGARLRYRDEGVGPALLFIHGWALDLDVWEPLVSTLCGRYRLLRFDRRGYGLSTGTPSLTVDERDALALLDRAGVRRAALVGASQGARVALRIALAEPERVTGLVLDAPPEELGGARALTNEVPLDHYRELARRGDIATVRRLWSQHPFTRLQTTDPTAHALLSTVLARYPGNDLSVSGQAPRALPDLSALASPVLVLNGERDLKSRRASGAALAAALPRARYRSIAGAGHLPSLDRPADYASALSPFIDDALTRERA
jgi:3-oxoadipate enol-lactonase